MKVTAGPIFAAAICVAALASSAAMAKRKILNPFDERGLGCWRKDETYGSRELCFRKNGIVDGLVVNAREGEGLGRGGNYVPNIRSNILYMLGSPGEGWPSPNYVEQCLYNFSADGQIMTLSNCGLAGEWQRVPYRDP